LGRRSFAFWAGSAPRTVGQDKAYCPVVQEARRNIVQVGQSRSYAVKSLEISSFSSSVGVMRNRECDS
jgi:hypothetical protein